jgi:MFS family permease
VPVAEEAPKPVSPLPPASSLPAVRPAPKEKSHKPYKLSWDDERELPQRPRDRRRAGEDEEEDDRGEETLAPDARSHLQTVQIGLLLVQIALVVALLGLAFVIALAVTVNVGGGRRLPSAGPDPIIRTLGLVMGGLFLLGVVLYYLGHLLCCMAPAVSGAAPVAIVSLVLLIIAGGAAVVVSIGQIRSAAVGDRTPVPFVIQLLIAGIAILGHLLFVLYLRGMQFTFGGRATGQGTATYLVCFILFVGANLLLSLVALLGRPSDTDPQVAGSRPTPQAKPPMPQPKRPAAQEEPPAPVQPAQLDYDTLTWIQTIVGLLGLVLWVGFAAVVGQTRSVIRSELRAQH